MSTFGHTLRLTTYGESHGLAVGCILEGVPPGLNLSEHDIQKHLDRRRPGQSILTTSRTETDKVEILSGLENKKTLGTPISLLIRNKDQRNIDYESTMEIPRPGHADYTYRVKYNGYVASSGGGRASARETIGRVAGGAIAEKWLTMTYGIEIVCWVTSVGPIHLPISISKELENNPPTRDIIERNGTVNIMNVMDEVNESNVKVSTQCPHQPTARNIAEYIQKIKKQQDSVGGIATCVIKNVPVGLGEPCFDKVEAELAKAMLSLPATKGFEIGDGFLCTSLLGSEHNDRFSMVCHNNVSLLKSYSNHAGGTLGGITTGNNIIFRVAFKPVSSIGIEQESMSYNGELSKIKIKGRHDPCVLPRCPPLIESMASLVIMDLALRQRARICTTPLPQWKNDDDDDEPES